MTFYSETTHVAAKDHRCCSCSRVIPKGERYTRYVGTYDGFQTASYHTDCRAAEIALNKRCGTDWDEWISLSDIESDDFDWLCADFPRVAARFGWSMYDWRQPSVGSWGGGFVMATPHLIPVKDFQ